MGSAVLKAEVGAGSMGRAPPATVGPQPARRPPTRRCSGAGRCGWHCGSRLCPAQSTQRGARPAQHTRLAPATPASAKKDGQSSAPDANDRCCPCPCRAPLQPATPGPALAAPSQSPRWQSTRARPACRHTAGWGPAAARAGSSAARSRVPVARELVAWWWSAMCVWRIDSQLTATRGFHVRRTGSS